MRILTAILPLFLAALPLFGQVTITGMTLEDVTITAAAVGGPTCSGDWEETFDGTGYVTAGWSETTSGTGAVDEDDSTRTETYFSGNSLRTYATGTFSNSYTRILGGAPAYDPFYMAVSFYLDSETLDDTENQLVLAIADSTVEALCVRLHDESGVLNLELHYGDNCDQSSPSTTGDTYTISLDTVYIIEVYADNVGSNTDVGGWRIFNCGSDGTSCTTTPDHTYEDSAMEILTGTADRPWLGQVSGAFYSDMYFGFMYLDSSQVCN